MPLRTLRGLSIGILAAALWPAYLGLVAYAARQAPWPRNVSVLSASVLAVAALAAFLVNLSRWVFRPGGWAETSLNTPPAVARQLYGAVWVLAAVVVLFLMPQWLLSRGVIAPGGRAVSASALCRLLILGFELTTWAIVYRLVRPRSAFMLWLWETPERLGWAAPHRGKVSPLVLGALGAIILLDVRGYSFTATRLAMIAGQSAVLIALCWGLYRMIGRLIDQHAWRWIGTGHGQAQGQGVAQVTSQGVVASGASAGPAQPDNLEVQLRRLSAYLVPILGLYVGAWVWDVDLAFFRFLGEQPLWSMGEEVLVTVGDVSKAATILLLSMGAWHYMNTFFALVVFPRMTEDLGVRFAVVTLCRYVVLGIGLMAALSSVHLGLSQLGVVLAALGVGLGFGLQEIVSNFVCGIILLLERPIRVGDIVTVAGMSGSVERINIRATTINNADNQSMIVPNRAFVTGNLVNWTLKDKVVRLTVELKVAHGADPDRVSDLLLIIAREDADVLRNPVPSAFVEEFGETSHRFMLHAYVPDPSLTGRVRHRLFAQIQRRFKEEGIALAQTAVFPLTRPVGGENSAPPQVAVNGLRVHPASLIPAPRLRSSATPTPAPVENCHRGIDE